MGANAQEIRGLVKASAQSLARPWVIGVAVGILFIGSLLAYGTGKLLEKLSAHRKESFLEFIHVGIDEALVPTFKKLSALESKIAETSYIDEESLISLSSSDQTFAPIFIIKNKNDSKFKAVSIIQDSLMISEDGADKIASLLKGNKILFANNTLIGEKNSYVVRKVSNGSFKVPDNSLWEIYALALPFDLMKLTSQVLQEVADKQAGIKIETHGEESTPLLSFGKNSNTFFQKTNTDTFDISIFDANLVVTVVTPSRFGATGLEKRAELLVWAGVFFILLILLVENYLIISVSDKALSKEKETEAKLKLKSEQLKTLLATAPIGIFISTVDGASIIGNDFFRSLFGLPLGSTKSEQWIEKVHIEEREDVKNKYTEACKAGEIFDREFRIVLKGEVLWRHMRTSPVGGVGGSKKITYYIGTVRDSNSKHDGFVNEQILAPTKPAPVEPVQSDRIDEALDAIADSIAACHQELKELKMQEEARAQEGITSRVEDKKPITINTRSTSIFESKKEESPSSYPHAVLSKVLSLLQYKATANGVIISMEIDSRAPKELDTPPWLLTQSLIEMIDTAITSSTTGSVKILYGIKGGAPFFSVIEKAKVGTTLNVSESNFSELNSPTFKALSEKSLSRIRRKNLLGRRFITSISLAEDTNRDAIRGPYDSSEINVLIVEDKADVSRHFESILKDLGLSSVTVHDAAEAKYQLASESFQFVIVDTSLGEISDYLRSRSDQETLPIIGIKSGNSSTETKYDQTVEKNCTTDELRAALEIIESAND